MSNKTFIGVLVAATITITLTIVATMLIFFSDSKPEVNETPEAQADKELIVEFQFRTVEGGTVLERDIYLVTSGVSENQILLGRAPGCDIRDPEQFHKDDIQAEVYCFHAGGGPTWFLRVSDDRITVTEEVGFESEIADGVLHEGGFREVGTPIELFLEEDWIVTIE